MSKTFIIAEAACTWLHGGLEAACRSIRAAKDCGADAWKTQFCSDPEAMAMRRGVDRDKYTRLGWSGDVLPKLKAECDRVGIEFMVTCFLHKDVAVVEPYVQTFKIAAGEYDVKGFLDAHLKHDKAIVMSIPINGYAYRDRIPHEVDLLHCVQNYPAALEALHLEEIRRRKYNGLSDHTTSVLTGAVAVGAGARIIEKHVRLSDTPQDDPDYGHSLLLDCLCGTWVPEDCEFHHDCFKAYVDNIREAERML